MTPPLVFVLGDSISIHYGPYLEARLAGAFSYARKTAAQTAADDLDTGMGANGGDSAMVLSYLREASARAAFQPDVLLLNCGLHDIKTDPATGKRQIALADYRRNLREIIALLATKKIPLVWVRTTHCVDAIHNARSKQFHRHAADVDAYNAAADQIMAETGTPSIDLNRFTRGLGPDAELFADHIHFNEAIRAQQGAFIAGWLIGRRG